VAAIFAIGFGTALAQSGNRVISGFVAGVDGQPLSGATVTLSPSGRRGPSVETITDAQGRFDFAALEDGRYEVVASHRGFAPSSYNQHGGVSTAIVTGENLETTGIVISLVRLASISGMVTEDSGDPVPHAQLHLFRSDPMREGVKQRANFANADEMGNFGMPELAPGTYYLCASGVPWYRPNRRGFDSSAGQTRSALDVAYAPACYPDGADPAAAEPMTVKAGEHIEVNLTLHAVPAIHVTFQVPKPEGNQGMQFPQLSQEIFGEKQFVQGAAPIFGNRNEAGGGDTMTVSMTGLAPGQYDVEFTGGANSGAARFGSIRASTGDIAVDLSAFQTAAAISGKVLMDGGGNAPESSSISFVTEERGQVTTAQIQPDGSFHFDSAPPGDYDVRINGGSGLLFASQLKVKGVAQRGTRLHVGSDPIEVTVIAGEPIATISGSVVRNGKAASGVFVLLVPEDLDAGAGRWIVNQSDSDGSFICEHVPAGHYRAVAIDEGWKLDWHRREVIIPYLAHGVGITIGAGVRTAALKSALEAQGAGGLSVQ
jgi:hypothetical protein